MLVEFLRNLAIAGLAFASSLKEPLWIDLDVIGKGVDGIMLA